MRRVLVSLLVAAMVLGLVGTAFAGYTDTAKNKYVDKVSAFGWMNGYPDGTFKPAGNITRAEAAAVVVRALGLDAAAEAAKGLGSKFSDVAGTHWASGYINVCTTKNILKGYPDGTFKPEANVTNAEIITMLVRALNRESEAIGEWPVGHITVAAANNIIGTGFSSSTPASRENVATYVAKAADVKLLKLTSNGWEEDTKTMASMNDLTRLKEYKVDAYDTEGKQITLKDVSVTPNVSKTYDLVANYVISDGKALRDLLGYTVDAYVNDDDDVVFVQVVSTTTSKSGTIKSLGSNYFYMYDDSKKYELAPAASIFRNGVAAPFTTYAVDDAVEFYMENNLVSYVKATRNDVTDGLVEAVRATGEISSQYLRYTRRGSTFTKYMDEETIVTLDGVKSTLSAIKEDMIVNIQLDPNDTNVALVITASSKTVSGKITAKRGYTDSAGDRYYYVSIDGVEYRIGSSSHFEDESYVAGTDYGADQVYAGIDIGDTITARLAVNGRIRVADVATGTANYGKIVGITRGGDYEKVTLDIKGTQVVYEVVDTWTWPASMAIGDYVKIERNNAGRLTSACKEMGVDIAYTPAAVPGHIVLDVLTGDKLIKVSDGGAPATITWLSVGDGSVVYVDGEYGTVGAISKDSRIQYVKTGDMKIAFALVDTLSEIDSGLITAKANNVIQGLDDSVEKGSSIQVFASATNAATATSPLEFSYNGVAGVYTGVATDGPVTNATTVKANADGAFKITVEGAAPDQGAAPGSTVYLRITDPMGNYTVLAIKLAN